MVGCRRAHGFARNGRVCRERRHEHGCAHGAGNAGRRSATTSTASCSHGVQRRVPRLGGRRTTHGTASDPWNIPSTINGWQEFCPDWKDQLTDQKAMGAAREVRDRLGSLLPPDARAADEPELLVRPELQVGFRRRRGHDPRRGVPRRARADRGAPRRLAGSPDDRRRGQQPAELHERRRSGSAQGAATLTLSNVANGGALRRHVGRRDDDGRVPGAAPLVPGQPARTRRRRSRSRCSTRRPAARRTERTSARARSTTRRT